MELNAGYFITLAEVELERGEVEAALNYCEKAKEIDPDYLDWDKYEIHVWMSQGDYYKVSQICSRLYEKNQDDVELLEIWQEACENIEYYQDAVNIGYEAIGLGSQNPEVYKRIAHIYAMYEQYRDAISVLEPVADTWPEFHKDLSCYYYEIFSSNYGHCGSEEYCKAKENAAIYRARVKDDWVLDYNDAWLEMSVGENDKALACLDKALQVAKETLAEEEFLRAEADIYWVKGKACISARENLCDADLKAGTIQRALEFFKTGYSKVKQCEDIYLQLSIIESMVKCWRILGLADEGISFLEAEKDICETDEFAKQFFYDWNRDLYFFKKDFGTGREYMLKRWGSLKLSVLKEYSSDKDISASNINSFNKPSVRGEVERIEDILSYMVYCPEAFEEGEAQKEVDGLISFVEAVIDKNFDYMSELIPIIVNILHYGVAISGDYGRIYKMVTTPFVKKLYSQATSEYRGKYNKYLMRVCYYLGKERESQIYAKDFLEDETKSDPYCVDKGISFEDVCEKEITGRTRLKIASLGTAYLYMGRVEEAKACLLKMMVNPMCWYCEKTGCLEYFLLRAEIAIVEGRIEEALDLLDKVDATEWHGHEEVATALRRYIK